MPDALSLQIGASENTRVSQRAAVRNALDVMTVGAATSGALGMLVLLALLASTLLYGAWPAIKTFGYHFLFDSDWNPVESQFGAKPVIFGTLVSSFLALLFAVPVSVGAAVFLTRLCPKRLVTPISFLIELLAAIPSIAYGLWGMAVLVPFLQHQAAPYLKSLGGIPILGKLFSGPFYGMSMLSAALVIGIMIIPIVTAVTRDVLQIVPGDIEEGAYALGATWWQATKVSLAYGKMGILGAIILGLARAIGETMAVTMVIGNTNVISPSLFSPAQTMASLLANEFIEADKPEYLHALIYVAFLLLLLTLVLNFVARLMVMRMTRYSASAAPAPLSTTAVREAESLPDTDSARKTALSRRYVLTHYNPRIRMYSAVMKSLCYGAAILTIALLAMIISYVIVKGAASLNWDFFSMLPGPAGERSGMRNCIMGTVVLVILASLIGIPLGMLCGIYLAEYSTDNWFSSSVRLVVDVLAGTPSIIVGVLAYQLVVLPMGHFSGWAGSMALAFMMCPIIARTTEEMLKLVPHSFREASLGLGGSRFQTLLKVILPAARGGIITGIMLSVARIAGETAPLLFTAMGSDSDIFSSTFPWINPNQQFPSLTVKIFTYATSAEPDWKRQAWAGMLVLISVILALSALMRVASRNKMMVAR